jgi:YD repeat-containing protein
VRRPLNAIIAFDCVKFSYDGNGNLTDDGVRTYQWDAENRLIGIGYKANKAQSTVFSYDGLGRRLAIVEKVGDTRSETRYVWCRDRIVGATTFDGVTHLPKRGYVPIGQVNIVGGGTGYSYIYYGQDHLGTVRDVIDSPSGAKGLW